MKRFVLLFAFFFVVLLWLWPDKPQHIMATSELPDICSAAIASSKPRTIQPGWDLEKEWRAAVLCMERSRGDEWNHMMQDQKRALTGWQNRAFINDIDRFYADDANRWTEVFFMVEFERERQHREVATDAVTTEELLKELR